MVLERVFKTITRYNMFDPGHRVGVAVSGGADSVFLLHALLDLAPRLDLKLSVLHLDHGLRGDESRADAIFVRDLAARLGLPAFVAVAQLETADNLEQTARNARRRFYLDFVQRSQLDRIATGHTRSDQAETVLFRFLRGSGTAGLSGVRPMTTEGLARPLIDLDRADIECYLRSHSIPWREDSTNASRDFARNRIRHDLLPQLIRDWNPALVENLAHTAKWAQDEEAYWATEIDRLAATLLVLRPPAVLLRSGDLRSLQPAVARRLVRKAIELAKGDLRGIAFHHVTRLLEMAASPEGHDCTHAPGLNICRSFDWIRIAPPHVHRNFSIPVTAPGRFKVPGVTVELDFAKSCAGMELRNWRPGDRYRPLGRATEERIKVLFQEARIPLWERRTWPILAIGDDIIWARLFGPATSAGSSVVKVSEYPTDE